MKRYFHLVAAMLCLLGMASCSSYETYADMKAKEQDAISRFISTEGIQVISESTFNAQGQTTDLEKNEFVRFDRNGVYMQIVRSGCGEKLEENKDVNLLCRFMEKNIMTDSVLIRNDQLAYFNNYDTSEFPDIMTVKRTGTTITASYVQGMMYVYHGSASVPKGWLVPLSYVKIGRPVSATDEISCVRLIVPHSQGTSDASASVYPCYYEITYERER